MRVVHHDVGGLAQLDWKRDKHICNRNLLMFEKRLPADRAISSLSSSVRSPLSLRILSLRRAQGSRFSLRRFSGILLEQL